MKQRTDGMRVRDLINALSRVDGNLMVLICTPSEEEPDIPEWDDNWMVPQQTLTGGTEAIVIESKPLFEPDET